MQEIRQIAHRSLKVAMVVFRPLHEGSGVVLDVSTELRTSGPSGSMVLVQWEWDNEVVGLTQ